MIETVATEPPPLHYFLFDRGALRSRVFTGRGGPATNRVWDGVGAWGRRGGGGRELFFRRLQLHPLKENDAPLEVGVCLAG